PFTVQWFLHGYFHQEDAGARRWSSPSTPVHWFARRWLTAGEAEFLALRGWQLEERLAAGIACFRRCFGQTPLGFVAPAWLYNEELIPTLERFHVRFTESHFHVFDLPGRRAVRAPVVTWATRSVMRRSGSRAAAAIQRRLRSIEPLVRIALHPADFDHPRIVDSVARTIDALRVRRRIATYAEACATEL